MTILIPCSRRSGSSARAATSFEPPAFQGTMKVMSRCGKFDSAWPVLPCIVAAKASATAAVLIIFIPLTRRCLLQQTSTAGQRSRATSRRVVGAPATGPADHDAIADLGPKIGELSRTSPQIPLRHLCHVRHPAAGRDDREHV